jgi:hypothetical protein
MYRAAPAQRSGSNPAFVSYAGLFRFFAEFLPYY